MRNPFAFPPPRLSLRLRFTLYSAALTIGVVVVLTALSHLSIRKVVLEQAQQHLQQQAARIRDPIERALESAVREVSALSKRALISNAVVDAEGRQAYLQPFLSQHELPGGMPYNLVLVDARGEALAARGERVSYRDAGWLRNVIERGRPYAGIEHDERQTTMRVAMPVRDRFTGSDAGALVLETRLSDWLGGARPPFTIAPDLARVDFLADGRAIASLVQATPPRSVSASVPLRSQETPMRIPLEIRVTMDAAQFTRAADELLVSHLLWGLLAVAIAAAASGLLARVQAGRIERLAAAASAVTAHGRVGDGLDATPFGSDEIGELADDLSRLLGRLKDHQDNLEALVEERTALAVAREADLNRAQAVARIGSWVIELPSNELRWSAETYRIFGLEPGTPLDAAALFARTPAADRDAVARAWDEALKSGRFSVDHRIEVGHEVRWVHEEAELVFAADGTPLRGVGTVQDVTEPILAEQALRASEARFRQLFEWHAAVMLLVDPNSGAIVDANPAAVRFYGYPLARLRQMLISEINTLPPEEIAIERLRALREERNYFVFPHRLASGRVRTVEVYSSPTEVDGRKLLFSIIHDITERKRAESALRDSEAYNKALFAASPIPLVILDPRDGRFIDCNPAAVALYRLRDRDEVIGKTPLDVSAPLQYDGTPSAEAADRHIAAVIRHGHHEFEWRHQRADGEIWDGEVGLTSFRHGSRMLIQVSLHDVTERRRSEARMREALVVFNASSQGIMTTDADSVISAVNPAFCAITGYRPEEVMGRKSSVLKSDRHDAAFYAALWTALIENGFWEGEIWNRRKNGEIYPQWLSLSAVRDDDGKIVEYVALFSDITERKQQEEIVWRQANFDAMTGLANRSLFADRLERGLALAHRHRKRLGLMFIDLDRFKVINDTLGHNAGDALLAEAARRLSACVRSQDTVARLGGDEFTVILHDVDDAEALRTVGEKIIAALARPFRLGGGDQFISGSVGIAVYPDDGEDAQLLLKNADIAMYQAKQGGKNRFQFFARHMQADVLARRQIEADLRAAIRDEAFVLHYQPIVDADSGELVGAEALLRWQHPLRGLVSPLEFLPVAEDSGLIVAIGEWALREAVRQWQAWRDLGQAPLRLAVNVSGVQFNDARLPDFVTGILADAGVERGGLLLEITESVLINGSDAATAQMRRIRDHGIGYSLDDFGTGLSSLSCLKDFPVDVVKIDRSFVHDCPADRNDAQLVEAIINMAHSLDLRITAEGVENPAQMAFLRDLGCDYLQGHLISRPLPADEFTALLGRHRLLPAEDDASIEACRLLAALRYDELDVEDWLRRLLGERSPDLADYLAEQGWVIGSFDLRHAVETHLRWRQRLNAAIGRRHDVGAGSDDLHTLAHCELDAWIRERRDDQDPAFGRLDRAHREIHKLACQIVADYDFGHLDSARRTLAGRRFRTASRNLVVALIDCFHSAATAPA